MRAEVPEPVTRFGGMSEGPWLGVNYSSLYAYIVANTQVEAVPAFLFSGTKVFPKGSECRWIDLSAPNCLFQESDGGEPLGDHPQSLDRGQGGHEFPLSFARTVGSKEYICNRNSVVGRPDRHFKSFELSQGGAKHLKSGP